MGKVIQITILHKTILKEEALRMFNTGFEETVGLSDIFH